MTWKILLHSYRMIANNLSVVFRIALVPWLVVISLISMSNWIGFGHFTPEPLGLQRAQEYGAAYLLGAFLLVAIFISVNLWIIVGWHRFILLAETPNGYFANWHGRQIFDYFVKGIFIVLILLIPLFAFGVVFSFLFLLIFGVVFPFLYMRISLVLPAAALGVPMKIGESWAATKDANMILLGLAVILMGSGIVMGLFDQLIGDQGIMTFVALFLNAAIGLLSVSILTTLYGVLVEGREL
jgi:hypothetical protein